MYKLSFVGFVDAIPYNQSSVTYWGLVHSVMPESLKITFE